MTFIVGTAVLMVLIYLGTGWLGIPEIYRVKATIWSIGALIALPVLWFIYALIKPAPQEESQTKTKTRKKGNINLPSGINIGKYTDGQEELSETGITYSGIKLPMRIKYIDKKMEVTDRDIIIHAVDMGYTNTNAVKPVRFEAFCKLRRKERTFIVSQILECHDAASESAITDIAAYVAPYLEDIEPYRRSNELYDTPPTKTVIRYQFRRPNYGEKPVTITGMGVYKSPNGPQRTLSYIRGIMDGKEEEKRFKIDRLAAISDPETGEIIPDILAFFLPHATIRQENSQISDAD